MHLPVQVGSVELHSPSGEVPSPSQVIGVVLDNPNPVAHVNEHILPWLSPSSQVGAFPSVGVARDVEHVIAENLRRPFINNVGMAPLVLAHHSTHPCLPTHTS